MKTITVYVHGDKNDLYDQLIAEGFSEEAAKAGSYATYELRLNITFSDDGEVLGKVLTN